MNLLWIVPCGAGLALAFAGILVWSILKRDEGTKEMQEIAAWVREGAGAYLKRQYGTLSLFFAAVFCVLLYMALRGYFVLPIPFAFLSGGFFSGLSGYIGMSVATRSSARTAHAARDSLNSGLRVAFSSGAVMGLVVVGLGLVNLSFWYIGLNYFYQGMEMAQRIQIITGTLLCSGLGASSMALFARVGGGIFTKAADIGADLAGKIEKGIPEDDPRNAAVIADQVGDNVGDVAGMGADLFESYIGSIVAAMALALAAGLGLNGVVMPMAIAAVGVAASIIGTFFVRCSPHRRFLSLDEKGHSGREQKVLLVALRRGIFITAAIVAAASFFLVRIVLGQENIGVYWALLCGLLTGIILGLSSEYYTSARFSPTRSVSLASLTGPATVIISGLSVGMLSTVIPILVVSLAILGSFYFAGGAGNFNIGLYGVGISAVGLLSTLGITLAADSFGPVADNAGGNAEMSGQPKEVRRRTDALDALGNTTAATGKGFAIGSAALTALALIAAYRNSIYFSGIQLDLSLLNPRIIVGLFIGGMLPFAFSALTLRAVGRAASKMVMEVRRQFEEIQGLIKGEAKPDYARCVSIATKAAQGEMIAPSLLAILAPLAVGILIGIEAEVGLLTGALISGFVLAVMMANAGGAWDNAKKFIEHGHLGGKGSPSHSASIVGDTVGDPCKDAAGPSLNILIKLMSIVSIVFLSLVIKLTLVK